MVTQTDIGRTQSGNGARAWLSPSAAASLRRVDRQLGRTVTLTWGGRSWGEQQALWDKYGPPRAAKPGTSPHESGNAIDTDEWVRPGFVALMAENGWKRTLSWEDWHFVHANYRDEHLNDPAPSGGATTGGTPAQTTEDDMDCMILINGKIYALAPGFIKHCDSTAQVTEAKARGVRQYDYTGSDRLNQWVRALDFYGVPRDALDKNGYVINPETGKAQVGGLWTWSRVVLAAVRKR